MAIANRELDPSEKRQVHSCPLGPVSTGVTLLLYNVECPSSLDAAQCAAFGFSGSPVYTLFLNRFIVGSGYTAIALGTSFAPVAFGTSGVQNATFGISLPALSGLSAVTQLQTNDVISLVSGGSNAAAAGVLVSLVLRPLVDVKSYYNIL